MDNHPTHWTVPLKSHSLSIHSFLSSIYWNRKSMVSQLSPEPTRDCPLGCLVGSFAPAAAFSFYISPQHRARSAFAMGLIAEGSGATILDWRPRSRGAGRFA